MEGSSWPARSAAGWQRPPLLPLASPPVQPQQAVRPPNPTSIPPPFVAPSLVLPPGGGNQMDMNFKQLYRPFNTQRAQTDNFVPSFNSSAFGNVFSGYCKPGKAENANSFLHLLSGPSYFLQREHSQWSNSHPEAPISVHLNDNVPVVSEAQSHVSHQHAAVTADRHGRLAGSAPNTHSFAVPGPQANLMPSHFPVLHHGSQEDSFHCNSRPDNSCRSHAFTSSAIGDMALFKRNGLSTASAYVNANFSQNLDMKFTPKNSLEIKSTAPEHFYMHKRQGLRVFCMGTVGELFLNDNGHIGIICFCHSLHMSIAKFCEHSGSFMENPGEAVHLENGETIAQWRRLLFLKSGIRVPDDDNGWLWHDCAPKSDSAVGSKDNNRILPVFYGTQQLEPLFGFGRPGIHSNSHVPSIQSYAGHSKLEKSLTGVSNNTLEKNATWNQHPLIRSCSESLHTSSSLPSSDCMMAKVNSCNHLGMENFIFNHGPQNIDRPIAYHVKTCGKSVEDSNLQNPLTSQNFSANLNANWEAFSSKKPSTSAILNEKSSNIELSLGQPSWQSYTSIDSDSESGRLQGQFDLKTPQMLEFISPRFNATKIAAEARQDQCCTLAEAFNSKISKAQHPYGIVGTNQSSGLDEINGELNKDSLTSLFLSHLNTFGGSSSQANGNYFSSKDNHPPEAADINSCAGYGTYLSRKLSSSSERPCEMIGDDSLYLVKKGKGVTSSSEKWPPDSGRPVEACQGCSFRSCSSMLDCNNSGYVHTFSELPVKDIDTRTLNQYGHALFFKNPDNDSHTTLKYPNSAIFPPIGPSFLSVSLPINHSSMNSTCTTGTIPPLTSKKSPEVHLQNENVRFTALEHMQQLSRQEVVSSSLNKTFQEGRTCCPQTVQMQTKDSQSDMTSLAERRCGAHCSIKKDFLVAGATSLPPCCHSRVTVLEPAGLNTCCHQTLSMQRVDSFSEECSSLYRHCHACGANKWPLLKCCGIDHAKKEIGNISGSFGCHFLSKCMAGYCIPREEGNLHASTKHKEGASPQVIHSPIFSGGFVRSDNSALIGHESLNGKTDTQMAQWRDVPGKSIPKTIVSSIEKPQKKVQVADVTEGHIKHNASKQFNAAFAEGRAMMKRQISNASSGCSAPAVTEVSADANNVSSYEASNRDRCLANDPVDAESVAGKDSSCDEISNQVTWEKSLPSGNMDFTRGSESMPCQLTDALLNKLNAQHPFKPKKLVCHIQTKGFIGEKNPMGHSKRLQKMGRRNRASTKGKKVETSLLIPDTPSVPFDSANCIHKPEQQFSSQEIMQDSIQTGNTVQNACIDFKRKRSQSTCAKLLCLSKSDGCDISLEYNHLLQTCDTPSTKVHKGSHCKKCEKLPVDCENPCTKTDDIHEFAEKHSKYVSLSGIERFSMCETKLSERKSRPEVCDNSGIISNGDPFAESRPPKMVSLSSILKDNRSCVVAENEPSCRQISTMEMKKQSHITVEINCNEIDVLSQEQENKSEDDTNEILYPGKNKKCFRRNGNYHPEYFNPSKSRRYKETRKRRLDELNGQVKHLSDAGKGLEDKKSHCELLRLCPSSKSQNFKDHKGNLSQEDTIILSNKGDKCQTSPLYSDAFCSVCGSSDKDDINRLIECHKCLIRVHQACYGILKVPKGPWCCRPCRTNSKNIACVLCGYEGGAMTRAIRSRTIIRSLLKCWQVEKGSKPPSSHSSEDIVDGLKTESINETPKCYDSFRSSVDGPVKSDSYSRMSMQMDLRSRTNAKRKSENLRSIFWLQNSITAGVLDPSTAQWVHMVCGLWTPGTRCPNVDTMSAFDVSGAFSIKKSMVCTMCNRPGGSCIQCRVSNCSAHFHPWCAHKMGLLQSETEGSDDENVGFYGRCLLHAPYQKNCTESGATEIEVMSFRTNDFSCARTEGYKGRKKEWFNNNLWRHTNETAGYVVPQEQINTWLHISRQKSHSRGTLKPPVSDSESSCRIEYIRFKQAKGWKHLVVYKSGIHALGLYTTQFIACGAMVVEYVGEIVGLRVADKREIGYQSGRRLQYKSACYFFRIDREYIIDATRKGGIARFVNHSCLPNCVAKVISVKNEKKVVFFAERDINPGEEITYDYHFNHEDEGQKIPCFCKSKNCRRYLN